MVSVAGVDAGPVVELLDDVKGVFELRALLEFLHTILEGFDGKVFLLELGLEPFLALLKLFYLLGEFLFF